MVFQVGISFAKVVLLAIQPGTEVLGQLPGTEIFVDTNQYPIAVQIPGVLATRIKSSLFCFANANFIAERYIYTHIYIYAKLHLCFEILFF